MVVWMLKMFLMFHCNHGFLENEYIGDFLEHLRFFFFLESANIASVCKTLLALIGHVFPIDPRISLITAFRIIIKARYIHLQFSVTFWDHVLKWWERVAVHGRDSNAANVLRLRNPCLSSAVLYGPFWLLTWEKGFIRNLDRFIELALTISYGWEPMFCKDLELWIWITEDRHVCSSPQKYNTHLAKFMVADMF